VASRKKSRPFGAAACRLAAAAALALLAACSIRTPNLDAIRDSKLFDRRIKETPREKCIRECRQESDRFRVDCVYCHTTNREGDIAAPDRLALTDKGRRARVMRTSPTFGLQQQCGTCHQSKFSLNGYAQQMFGPQGEKRRELEESLNRPVQ
jgi:hypothetical protein